MVLVKYYSTGIKEDIECNLLLGLDNSIIFESEKFNFKIQLNDCIDREEFKKILLKKEKKAILSCNLKKDNKQYKGPRKLLLKEGNLAISMGGIRLELSPEIQEQIAKSLIF